MRTILKLAIVAVAAMSLNACCECGKPKFNAKEYAERRTEKLDEIVDLTDAQEKEVYAVYLAQGKEIQKSLKNIKKECPEGKKAECKKAECDKAKCEKPCDKKCDKATCDKKAECKKAECDKAKCEKPCDKKCDKAACDKKAECKKAECDKAECDKAKCEKAKCEKPCDKKCDKVACDKKAECKKAECGKKPIRRHVISPEVRKANIDRIRGILTPEQNAKFKEHLKARRQCAPEGRQCIPTPKPACPATK